MEDADPLALDPQFAARLRPAGKRHDCQIYLISPNDVGGNFPDHLRAVLDAAPVTAFQFRLKGVDQHAAARLAEPLQAICAATDVAFIVNDDMGLAKRLGADGVHLGQGDGDVREARRLLGPDAQIGVTCHASRHLAMEAGEAGADYVAFGAFFPTTTKKTEHVAGVELLGWWSALSDIACVAIGGIDAGNCAPLVRGGADFLAVSGGVWNHADGAVAGVQALHRAIAAAD